MKTKSYFISDLHLGARYIEDPKAHEQRIVNWLESIAPDARHLFMLGDVMDYWYEYRYVAPRGFIRFLGSLARLADSGTEIVWLKGNHDIWIFDYLPNEVGLKVVDGLYQRTIDGRMFVMEHGDGVGKIGQGYKMMRRVFRNRLCQRLYSAIHPRWTISFAKGWSNRSRINAPTITEESKASEIRRLSEFVEEHNASLPRPADFYIFGHIHTPIEMSISSGQSNMVILGDCFKTFSFGEWDGQKFSLKIM